MSLSKYQIKYLELVFVLTEFEITILSALISKFFMGFFSSIKLLLFWSFQILPLLYYRKYFWKYKNLFFEKTAKTTCKDCKGGGLKNFDISYKIISIQCSWIRRLYDNNFHEWNLIPLHLITMSFGSKFKFHSNVFF